MAMFPFQLRMQSHSVGGRKVNELLKRVRKMERESGVGRDRQTE